MSDLRSATIRLAYAKPELRSALLPVLKEAGGIAIKSMIAGIKNHMKGAEPSLTAKVFKMVGDYFDKEFKTLGDVYEALEDADMRFLQKLETFVAKENDLWFPSNHSASEKTAAVRKPLYGHTSPQTAYVVDDYPYGFKLRTKARFWIESNPTKGYRFVSQTMDPKRPGEIWNKPKASTYSTIAGELYLDEKDHVQWSGVTPYSEASDVVTFLSDFPHADKTQLKRWIPMKIKLYEKLLEANATGSSGWAINGVQQPATEADIGRNRQSLEDWTAALKKL